ncbi:MAG: excinuclease ABC subunit UvrC [Candidatus Aminicenantes bacterium]|nr:excinuclease ABC subunit UvrC [Candidatus Aminicenantes bacterium]
MTEKLKRQANLLPEKPGIYLFKNESGEIIYVGKARSIRERVLSYFQPSPDPKVQNIMAEAVSVDFILTDSEKEAAFLENNFIQKHQPKFNLRLKDDKSFPYLKITCQDRFPGVYLCRRVENDGARYFGPFSPARSARTTIHLLNKYFGLRPCEEKIPGHRTRPCLEYEMKLCSGPCVGFISEEEYRKNVDNALLFLEGKTEKLLTLLHQRMMEAAENLAFEQAAHWRDTIRAIDQIREKPKLISVGLENADIVGLARKGNEISFYVFFMRRGKVIESEEIVWQEKEPKEITLVLKNFLLDFYSSKEIPERILLPLEPQDKKELEYILQKKRGQKINLIVPRRGKDREIVNLANRNAEFLLFKGLAESESLLVLQKSLGLEKLPKRIEGFDISNTGGEESVGSMVVFIDGLPEKREYRRYRVRTVTGPDDIASLKEVLERRYRKTIEEGAPTPDLILIDGGKGQLQAAKEVLTRLKLPSSIALIALAKKEEIIYSEHHPSGLHLESTSPALKLLQHIRDEAHRFALSLHRQRREKKSFASELQTIPGIGPKRLKILFSHFESLEEIKQAEQSKLQTLIGRQAAIALKNYFLQKNEF